MRRSKSIDLTKVPIGDLWGGREYLLAESLTFILEQSKEHISNRYTLREQLENSHKFMVHDLTWAPAGDWKGGRLPIPLERNVLQNSFVYIIFFPSDPLEMMG